MEVRKAKHQHIISAAELIKFHYRIISPKPLAPKGIDNHLKHSSIQIENPSFGPQNPNSPLRYQRYPTWHSNLRFRGNVRPQRPLKNFQNSTYVQRGNTDLNSTFSVSKTPVAIGFIFTLRPTTQRNTLGWTYLVLTADQCDIQRFLYLQVQIRLLC